MDQDKLHKYSRANPVSECGNFVQEQADKITTKNIKPASCHNNAHKTTALLRLKRCTVMILIVTH